MYTTPAKMLADAKAGGYAVGAFNFENMEMAMAIVSAAEECRAPVMLQTTPSTLKYGTPEVMCAIAKAAAAAVSVPVACHLDHGNSVELAGRCLAAGYSSLMIDGSKLPFDGNVAVTKQVVAFASGAGVPVEAELGMIGHRGRVRAAHRRRLAGGGHRHGARHIQGSPRARHRKALADRREA